mmetsp:Transcript_36952/g.99204  ORF Transcript_36952/g.99204 Transcript_36952/m.99204 type:complete len:281 (-) Transcript_36952:1018-1860(-)
MPPIWNAVMLGCAKGFSSTCSSARRPPLPFPGQRSSMLSGRIRIMLDAIRMDSSLLYLPMSRGSSDNRLYDTPSLRSLRGSLSGSFVSLLHSRSRTSSMLSLDNRLSASRTSSSWLFDRSRRRSLLAPSRKSSGRWLSWLCPRFSTRRSCTMPPSRAPRSIHPRQFRSRRNSSSCGWANGYLSRVIQDDALLQRLRTLRSPRFADVAREAADRGVSASMSLRAGLPRGAPAAPPRRLPPPWRSPRRCGPWWRREAGWSSGGCRCRSPATARCWCACTRLR